MPIDEPLVAPKHYILWDSQNSAPKTRTKNVSFCGGYYRTKPLYFVYIHVNRRDPKRTPRTPLAGAELHVGGPENTRTKRAQNGAQNPKIPTI